MCISTHSRRIFSVFRGAEGDCDHLEQNTCFPQADKIFQKKIWYVLNCISYVFTLKKENMELLTTTIILLYRFIFDHIIPRIPIFTTYCNFILTLFYIIVPDS